MQICFLGTILKKTSERCEGLMLNMLQRPKRVAAIQDLSGFGRCSLTVIIPILSSMGIQVCPVPTTILSTHTGGLQTPVFLDLTDYVSQSLAHYRQIGVEFESVYTGFLGSEGQIDHCLAYFAAYPDAFLVVDPVMGDEGKTYKTYTPEMVRRMAELVAKADMITPNLTESCILLGEAYPASPITRSQAKSMLVRLSEKGPKIVVVTGVHFADGTLANIGYEREKNAFWSVSCRYVPVKYPGTGDAYTRTLLGALLGGESLPAAMERATRFLETAIKTTYGYGSDPRHGVMLEMVLHELSSQEPMAGYQIL